MNGISILMVYLQNRKFLSEKKNNNTPSTHKNTNHIQRRAHTSSHTYTSSHTQ